jgi:hypothetical protein
MTKWEMMEEGIIPLDELDKRPTLHFCYEWDGLVIEEGDAEFECCNCFEENKK